MGCNCSDEKKTNNSKNKIIISNNLIKNKNNTSNQKEDQDKISSLSSINSDVDINNSNNPNTISKKKDIYKIKNNLNTNNNNTQKNNIESLDFSLKNSFPQSPHNFADIKNRDKEIIPSNREYICNIHTINYDNGNNNKKYRFKYNQISPMKNLLNLIKKEDDYKYINKNLFLFYKGNRIYENDTIYNIINKKDNQIDNILNYNNINKPKDINEIDFDMISFSIIDENNSNDDEENINEELNNKKEKKSFSSNEYEIEKNDIKNIDKKNLKQFNKDKEISKKLMNKLSPICKKHNQEHLIYICLTCFNSFCNQDFNEHKRQFKNHEIIQKSKLIELNYDIKKIKTNIINIYKEIFPELYNPPLSPNSHPDLKNSENLEKEKNKINYISSNDLFSKLKLSINDINEQMENLYDSYIQAYYKMNSKYLSLYEEKMPKIIEYDEYIEKTLINLENLNIYTNENIFIDNYNNCINITKTSSKYYQIIISLKEIILKYKEFLELFEEKGKELIEYINKGIDEIMKFKNGDKIFNINGGFLQFNEKKDLITKYNISHSEINNINSNNIKNRSNTSLITSKDFSQKISLKFLLSEKKNKLTKSVFNSAISKTINNNNVSNGCSSSIKKSKTKNYFKEKNNIEKLNFNQNKDILPKYEKETEIKPHEIVLKSPSNVSSKAQFKFEINSSIKGSLNSNNNEDNFIQNHLFYLLYGTQNIIQYIHKDKKINIYTPDISILKIKKFESYISCVNYKNKFYISGGYSTSKQFFEYDINNNKFIKLPEMLSNHYYHTMIGNGNFIYSISGFKSKKIEKYNIYDNNWISLPDLAFERTFPNALIYNNNIFIFGKINNSEENENNIIEYINISENENNNSKWNQIKIKNKFPFNSGIIMLEKNSFLLVGGKIDLNENSINNCYSMIINKIDNKYKIDIKLSDIKLDQVNEFNGNIFSNLDENNLNYGLFSSNNPFLLCIYNKKSNSFSYIQSENKE